MGQYQRLLVSTWVTSLGHVNFFVAFADRAMSCGYPARTDRLMCRLPWRNLRSRSLPNAELRAALAMSRNMQWLMHRRMGANRCIGRREGRI